MSELLERYDLEAGDEVRIDAGTYSWGRGMTLGWEDSGEPGNPVVIGGTPHGKTIIEGTPMEILQAQGVTLQNLWFANASAVDGVSVTRSENIRLSGVDVVGSRRHALQVQLSSNVWADHCLFANALTNGVSSLGTCGLGLDFCTVCSNGSAQISMQAQWTGNTSSNLLASWMGVSNSIMSAKGTRIPIYDVRGTLFANHNDLHTTDGGLVALTHEGALATERGSVNAWYNYNGQDAKSLSYEPGFANARYDDFHLKSTAGRYDPNAKDYVTTDTETSALVDAADSAVDCSKEPAPNGGRANLGRYGGTDEASKTSAGGGLTLVALNDGGKASGNAFPITWLARGSTTNATLTISYWNGGSWQILANGVPADNEVWYWDTTTLPASVQGRIKLEASDGTSPVENAIPFAVRNEGDRFTFYVNDGSREGDEYCTAVGKSTNDGLTQGTPMDDLNALLQKYTLESGDTVLVDTGRYLSGIQPWRITQGDSAAVEGKTPVVIQGATNRLFNGTVLDRQGNAVGISAEYTVGLKIRNITVSNASETAFVLINTYETALEWCTARNQGTGASISGGSKAEVNHCAFLDVAMGVSASGTRGTDPLVTLIGPVLQHNLLRARGNAVVSSSGNWSTKAKHNVLIPATGRTYAYSMGIDTSLEADYNAIWTGLGGRVSEQKKDQKESPVPVVCETVGAWVNLTGNDGHSYDADPGFVDYEGEDFHLKSRGGRYNPATKKFVNDQETSALVDAGDSEEEVGEEPNANGGRVNIGLYGGTQEASKSDGTGRYNLLTYNNGGVASGRVKLAWNALGSATGTTVRIEVSLDGGATWPVKVGDGIPAESGEVLWNSENAGASALAKWRVVDEEPDTTKAVPTQASESCFVLHNNGIGYYVNDGLWSSGDYCTAAGDDSNDGLSPGTPKRNLEAILDAYNLEPGDIVYVDGGTYMREGAVTVGDLDSGAVGRGAVRVRIQGQTNENAEKSVFVMLDPEADVMVLDGAYGVVLSHLEFVGATNAIRADGTYFIEGEWLTMRDGHNGVSANASSNLWLRHSLFRDNRNAGVYFSHNQMGSVDVSSSVFWSNRYGIFLYQGHLSASNNIYGVFGKDSFAYYQRADRTPRGLQSDYNGFHLVGGHADGDQTGELNTARTSLYSRVSTWATRMGQDTHSLSQDPRFVDPDHGDFHLKSVNGHWGGSGKGWVTDSESSPMIDAGGPTATGWLAEPDPNGRKLNIGLYGGTDRASKTPQAGWLTPLTLVDGGSEAGDIELCWQAGGAATNDTVTIEFSYDNGVSWTNTIVSGWPATEGSYVWKSGEWGATALGQWRIYSDRDQSIVGGSHTPFVLRNSGTILYYVNNDLEKGDVYCTAAGDDANDGLTPGTPKATVQAILSEYELEPEDIILVDAGRYVDGTYPIVIDGTDSGWSNRYVTIQGSTNPAARTIWHAPSRSEAVCSLSYAENVCLRNLTLENANVGVLFDHAINCRLEDVRVERNPQVGVSLVWSEGTELSRTLLWKNVSTTGGVAVAFQQSGGTLNQCVVWGSQKAISVAQGDSISISNSVLDARSEIGRIYSFGQNYDGLTGISADYNAYHVREGAIVGEQANRSGGNDLYKDLLSWSESSGNDRHSLMEDPGFADSEGDGDFHLLSPAGRFTTNNWYETTNHWVEGYGTTWSPLIDAGNPHVEVTDEPAPNGGVVNIGIYGNTAEASKTPTNPPWVRAMSYNTPGTITKTALLYWNYGGQDSGRKVTLEYRPGYEMDGQPWVVVATNVPLEDREYEWDVSELPLTVALKWRITVEETGYSDESDAYVAVKTKNYVYYVNDSSLSGDVYCTGVGQSYDTGVGTNAAVPIDSILSLFEHYPVGAGDVVKVDTGTYALGTNAVSLTADNMGTDGFPLEIIGSTNFIAGGTTFQSSGTTNGIILQNTRRISLSNLRVTGAKNGVALLNVSDIGLDGMDIRENQYSGIYVDNGANVSVRRSLLADNGEYGFQVANAPTGIRSLENVTLANNGKGAIFTTRGVQLDNSILFAGTSNTLVSLSGDNAYVSGDYNLFQWGAGGGLATNNVKKQHMTNVRQWQEQSGGDQHSFRGDPLFVDAAGGDYHVKSRGGCWSNGVWSRAEATSWAIDGGNPESEYGDEPDPNGNRVNLGAYGGGAQASATDTSKPELLAMALADGGVAGQGQVLTWASRGTNANAAVRLEYSPDNGQTWQLIDMSTAGAGNAGYEWISSWTPSPLAQWRVVFAGNTNVWGQTGTNFTFRPTPLIYYVNDGSREGDVFTTAVGSAANNGYQTNSPLDSVAAVLARYQLSGEDELRVDTGVYELGESVEWSGLNAGSSGKNVLFRGSTNLAQKTVFLPSADMRDVALSFAVTHDVEVRDMTFAGFSNAIAIPKDNNRIFLSDLDLRESEAAAVSVNDANDVRLSRVLVRDGAGDGLTFSKSRPVLDGCVVWGNASNAISMGEGVTLSVTNSILSANGFGSFCYYASTTAVIRADYNNLYLQDAGQVASIDGVQYDKVPQWMRATSQDIHSLSTDPLFADAENGDFHVRSAYGRYDAALGRFVNDPKEEGVADVSPMVDAGHTNSVWGDEPVPNGGRRNIGLYGGTWQASKSDTNAWVTAVTAMSGGLLDGTFYLTWIYGGNVDTNELVRLEYSPRNGEDNTWEFIGNARLSQGMYYWASDLKNWDGAEKWQTSPEARWRIMLADTNVWDATDLPFGLRNKPFSFYLNDGDQTDDLWCTTGGLDTQSGFWPDRPKRTLQSLLENIDVEPTDEILVDTGTYYMGDTNWPVVWQYSDGGESGAPVRLSGSPMGATFVVSNAFSTPAIFSLDADYVTISNIGFRMATRDPGSVTFNGLGLVLDHVSASNAAVSLNGEGIVCSNLAAERGEVTVSGMSNRVYRMESRYGGVTLSGTNSVMANSLVYRTNNTATALVVRATSAALTNCTVVAPNGTAVGKTGLGTLSMEGNILVAGGDRRNAALAWKNGGLKSDWNDFHVTGTAWVGETEHSKWEKLMYWQRETGQDAHSLAIDPKFADMAGGDFHLSSTVGRWDAKNGRWLRDGEHSPLIDMGNPQRGTGDEVMPHGDTPNMGAYARTAEASQSVTNFWLLARTANDGGVLKGSNVVLRWSANMLGAWQNRTVTLQYWDGAEWRTIAGGISARAGEYVWDTTGITNNVFDAKWRVVCDQDGNVSDESDTPFALRNRTADFYVSAAGNDENDGLSTNAPMRTFQALFDKYDLEGGDTVHATQGDYTAETNVLVVWSRSGEEGNPVKVVGAVRTNWMAGVRLGAGKPSVEIHASNFQWDGLRIDGHGVTNGETGVAMSLTRNVELSGMDFSKLGTGIRVDEGVQTTVQNSSFKDTQYGIWLANSRTNTLRNLTMVGIPGGAAGIKLVGSDGNVLENNIFIPQAGAFAYEIGSSLSLLTDAVMDYNLYDFGAAGSGFHSGTNYSDLRKWQLAMDNDYRSALEDARLANPDRSDFHPQSVYGRWNGKIFTNSDTVTS
ncbi:MAG: right-handed parallel beta-helix repeat-containing protein, partial [Bacteroidales bacterium]|nr:right-handed parallel beta-helix repeat-containing protein [Bacteroidales bacterium]